MPNITPTISDAAARAYSFIEHKWMESRDVFFCVTSHSRRFDTANKAPSELFTTMMISELLRDFPGYERIAGEILHRLASTMTGRGTFHFFTDPNRLPADIDCTSVGLTLLSQTGMLSSQDLESGIRIILNNVNENGVIEVYINPGSDRRGIVDPVVCANAMYLLALYGVQEEAEATNHFLLQVLQDERYAKGTRYYPSRATILHRFARLVHRFPVRYGMLYDPLCRELRKCMGTSYYPLDLAQRIITASLLGMASRAEQQQLARLQNADGSWPADGFFRYGRTKIYFGSRALTTAFALKALYG